MCFSLLFFRRNKHGCEMCRCVKCPPFTCDKHCSEGYQQNRKGCNVCLCKGTSCLTYPTYCMPVVVAEHTPVVGYFTLMMDICGVL